MSQTAIGVADATLDDAASPAPSVPQERSDPAWGAVLSLTLGVFGLVTTEFLPASLLTPLATDLGVSEGAAGQAVTATAVVAAVTAPTLAILTRTIDRRYVMWGLTVLLVASNLLAALATSLPMLLLARVVLGVGLGGFWAMSGAIAMRLVPAAMLPRAMSIILTGVSVATVCAAPIGAYLGNLWGWRTTFLLAAVIGVLTLAVQLATIPRLPPLDVASVRALFEVGRNRMVRIGLIAILLVASGNFAGFTYVRTFLEQVPVLDIDTISLALLAFGIAGFFGNLAGGFVAGRSLRLALSLAPLIMAVAALILVVAGASPLFATIGIALWGFGFGGVPVSVQTWMIRAAPEQAESAGGLMVTAFQVAIASGAVFGGLLVDHVGVLGPFVLFGLAALSAAVVVALLTPRH
ncbi:MAG: MFS transporter [Mesorhizobium sp.]|nr:MFS transporter [Mesorhizobium sp.]MBN9243006.1 MFS transporter [Mesorhizobium sp.]